MRNGTLSRDVLWATPAGKHVRVRTCRLVSFEHRHVVAMSYEVVVDRAAPVVIRSRVINRANGDGREPTGVEDDPRLARRISRRVLDSCLVEEERDRLVLGYQTVESQMTLAMAVDHIVEITNLHRRRRDRQGGPRLPLVGDGHVDGPW
jgi:alpha,alpha-trehalose phosphorylase